MPFSSTSGTRDTPTCAPTPCESPVKFGDPPHAVEVNVLSRTALFRAVDEKFLARTGFALATLNLDHLTKLPRDPAFLTAYRAQDLVVADGWPIVRLARLAGRRIELMPGSDLILPLCEHAAKAGVSVALLGSSDAALRGAADALRARVPELKVVHCHAPPYGFDPASEAAAQTLRDVAASGAGLCFIALGAPKQEVLAARGREIAPQVGFASIGAGLDFLSGHQTRAPRIMRALALEWLWRAGQSPRRMVPRYVKCAAMLPGLVVRARAQR